MREYVDYKGNEIDRYQEPNSNEFPSVSHLPILLEMLREK